MLLMLSQMAQMQSSAMSTATDRGKGMEQCQSCCTICEIIESTA